MGSSNKTGAAAGSWMSVYYCCGCFGMMMDEVGGEMK